MLKILKSIAFRYGLPLLAFASLLLISTGIKRVFSLELNPALLIIALLIATAWYLGRNPGLLIAIVFEAAIIYYSTTPYDDKAAFATINRLALFISVVLFASSRRNAEQKLREQRELLQIALNNEHDARREAETAARLKDEFLATVSHELRTPLSAILGWAVMLKGNRLNEAEAKRAFEVIERNAKMQGEIIGDLLDISQIVTGKLNVEHERVPMFPVLKKAVESLQTSAKAKSITLTAAFADDNFVVIGDAERLYQVVSNLISNALKFTPDGGAVEIRTARRESFLEIAVTDSGIGIDAEFLPFIFDKFRQGDASPTRPHGGLGLGLAIVRYLVKIHGGDVSAESRGIGKGAVFTVRLPLAENGSKVNSASNSAI